MSIKDLFGKRSNQILTVEEYEKTVKRDGESVEQVEQKNQLQSRFVPRVSVDFDDPKTFARYGSAEKYYVDSINAVLNAYPYDGSLAEKTKWHNVSTYIDNYIFENEYPRATGYVSLNGSEEHPVFGSFEHDGISYRTIERAQLIYVKGGPNKTPDNPTGELRREYPEGLGRSNIFDGEIKRRSNLYCEGADGNTVEMWFKMSEDRESVDGNLCLFDLWNNRLQGTEQYARFAVELPEDKTSSNPLLHVTYVSGSAGVTSLPIGDRDKLPEGFSFSDWNHFSVSVYNTGEQLATRFYLNGQLVDEVLGGTSVGAFVGETNHLTATIGAMNYDTLYGSGAVRGSIDEFRFWKSARTSEEVGRSWMTQVYGGTNTDTSNLSLGVYYKFNEGIYDTEEVSSFDRQVLDYSGRISNGVIVNYSTEVRSLGSAINEKAGVKNKEFRDPVVYRTHPDVQALMEEKKLEGGAHDMSNNSGIYSSIPEWITTSDGEAGGNQLLDLTQIISSYFDTLHLQIEALPTLTNTHYVQEGEKPLPFAKHLLESVGFVAPEIFVDTTVLEALSDRNEERVFEEKIHNVKNLIYQNIYNNIAGIYKAKGTEKSFRNLMRCFGVGDELIKINLYGDGVTHRIADSYKSVSVKKNYLDFNNSDRHDSTVYQQAEPDNPASTSYIAGNVDSKLDYIPFTMEASVIFPKKFEIDHPQFYRQGFGFSDEAPSSIFGMHQAKADPSDLTWVDTPDIGFRLVCIKESETSRDAKFRFDARGFGLTPNSDNGYHNGLFETEYFYDIFDNSRWNFAVRIRTDKTPDRVHDSETSVRYFLELYAVSTLLDDVQEEFLKSYELPEAEAKAALNANKRIFLGAEYKDFNDNDDGVINRSDVKIGEVRYWQDYLDDQTIKYHAQDPDNYGVKDPYKPAYFNQTSVDRRVPQIDTLCLYWDFATVTKSSPSDGVDEAGNILSDSFFFIDDVSVGSVEESEPTGLYSWLGGIVKKQHTGKGDYYYPDDREVVDRNFLFAAKQNLPEIIGSSDTVKLLTQDDDLFTKNSRPVNYFWAIEKSMYQTVSQEIMEAFAGIGSFNNLLGDPVNRYRMEYKNLNKLRQIFFQKFQEAPKVERYVQFYKWIDSSISEMIRQLIPASANFSDDMRTMIESHILERNKYWNKFPTLEMKQEPPETSVLGINEMLYNWRRGHATLEEEENCIWWKDRAERDGAATSGDPSVDASRKEILDVVTTVNRVIGGETFALRSLSTPYRFNTDIMTNLHGGVNNKKNKKVDFVRSEVKENKGVSVTTTSDAANSACTDDLEVANPLLNRRLNIQVDDTNGSTLSLYELNENILTGENYWNSNHADTYGEDKDVPMQGVFTSAHVGGLQSRNVKLNDGGDNSGNRPEAWDFTITPDGADYAPVPLDRPRATLYRDEKAKRPVNIRNIKESYGNYGLDYEVVQTSGRTNNNRWLAEGGLDAENVIAEPSPHIIGMYDFELPQRGRNEHIFTERFSAPGGPDTLSRGMLDVEAEEFALYNALNYRNLDVRLHLKNWLTYHTKKWGFRSYYRGQYIEDCENVGDVDEFCQANFHKSHRNTAYRPESYDYIEFFGEKPVEYDDPCCDCEDDEYAEVILSDYRCKETHDNFWVTHQLPRSGHQYAWIKASTQRDIFEDIGGEPKTYRVCPWGYATDYANANAYHPAIVTNPDEIVGDISAYSKMVIKHDAGRVKTEDGFPFLNKFISISADMPHEPTQQPLSVCRETMDGDSLLGHDILEDSTYVDLDLNKLLLHRDGPYQHPSWKQTRGYENKLVNNSRKNNILSNLDLPENISTISSGKLVNFRERRAQTVRNYVEPAVSWNMPMRSKMQFHNSPSAGTVIHSYSNNLEVFSNSQLNRRLGLQKTAKQIYDILLEKYSDPTARIAPTLFELDYVENIFPKHNNASLDKVRSRRNYTETQDELDRRSSEIRTFWNADGKRQRTIWKTGDEAGTPAKNAFGYSMRRSSVWALDYDATIGTGSGENVALRGELAWAGDAQYLGYIKDGVNLGDVGDTEFTLGAWIAPRPRLQFIHNPRSNNAPEQAWLWKAGEISGNSPWYDEYSEFSKDVRLIGQNYSLTPEYNVSSHMDYYINKKAGNFKAENKNILELPGAAIPASAERYTSTSTYISWDGITPLEDINSDLVQPNHADGWNKYFAGTMSFNGVRNKESVLILEPPADINEINRHWKCADPYPVCKFGTAGAKVMKVSFEGTGLSSWKDGLSAKTDLTVNWELAKEDEGDDVNKDAMLERWENSVLMSLWVKTARDGNLLSFGGRGTATGKAETDTLPPVDLPTGLVSGIGKLESQIKKDTLRVEELTNKLTSYSKITSLSSSATKALNLKKEKTQIELSSISSALDIKIKDLQEQTKSVYVPPRSGTYSGKLIVEGENLLWKDTNGNLLRFYESEDEEYVLTDQWTNIALCYIGGNNNKDHLNKDARPRLYLFVNGEHKASKMDPAAQEYFSDVIAEDTAAITDGTILRQKEQVYLDNIIGIEMGSSLNGKATDLTVYRGNPGLSEKTQPEVSSQIKATEHWALFNSPKPDLHCSLAETIYDMQCEDANDIYDDWLDGMSQCKIEVTSKEVTINQPVFFPADLITISIDPSPTLFRSAFLDLKVAEATEIEDVLKKSESAFSSQTKVALPVLPPVQGPTATLIKPVTSPVVTPTLPPVGTPPEPDEPEAPPAEEPTEESEEGISDEPTTFYALAGSRCAELIGWWKLGVPHWEKETYEEYVWKEEFFKCFSHTDRISHIEKVREDHKALDGNAASMLRLEVDAIKKLLPYNGFYPSQRVVQLGALFFDSVMPHVEGKNDNQLYDRARTEQAALQPFFAPGILFNTIKSGIAVDWAAYTKSTEAEMADIIGSVIVDPKESDASPQSSRLPMDRILAGTRLSPIIKQNIASDLNMQMSLGRVKTEKEQESFIEKSYVKNIHLLQEQVSVLGVQAQNECTQQEYEDFAKVRGLDPKKATTEDKFRKAYDCPEFQANKGFAKPAVPSGLYSALGVSALGNKKQISVTAAAAVEELKRLPLDVGIIIPEGLGDLRPPVASDELKKYKEGKYLSERPSFRLPFESLVSLDSYLPQKNSGEQSKIFFLAPSYMGDESNNEHPYFEWTGIQDPLYEMAMNNFLAEVPNFFLKDSKITSFASQPENKFKPVKEGWTYYLDVHLYKTSGFEMTLSPHDGEMIPLDKDDNGRTFTTQGRYFGPALMMKPEQSSSDDLHFADPSQAAYVPPYFYGRAKARLSFTATRDGQPTLEEILNNLEIEYINEEMDELFSSLSGGEKITAESIFNLASGREEPEWKNTPAYQARMPMESCIKFDGKVNQRSTTYTAQRTALDFSPDGVQRLAPQQVQDDNQGTGVWVISPKFECPTFNFKTQQNRAYIKDNRCGTGIWGGYGENQSQKQGLFISIEESFKKRSDKPNKPLLCEVTNKEVQSVALGINDDTRYLHENVITLEDAYGNINTITIGQPQDSKDGAGFTAWKPGEFVENGLRKLIGIPSVDDGVADGSWGSRPFSVDAAIRTVGTSPLATASNPRNGMASQYDIEAYLQAESWMTDVFSLWTSPPNLVPKSYDVASAIAYHINYLHEEQENFPWTASVSWVNPSVSNSASIGGLAYLTRGSQQLVNPSVKFSEHTGITAIVEIDYDEARSVKKGKGERKGEPTVTLTVNQDSIRNPLGKLGVKYMNESGAVDLTMDSTDPEAQNKMPFYTKTTTKQVIKCVEAVGSLMDVCGFVSTKSRVGEVAANKEISEAVVMIPFVDNPVGQSGEAATTEIGGRNFFSISNRLFQQTRANVDAGLPAVQAGGSYNVAKDIDETSVSEMVKSMQKYNLPPQYDFMKYADINPFVMYIFEFKDNLNSRDLSNIWQGLMPERAKKAVKDSQVIEHELNAVNFFEGKKVPENIRWMVFRVKKKAKQSYWEMTADSGDDDRFKFDFNFGTNSQPDYSYNWPYDFCSLIEMCKVRGGISILPNAGDIVRESEPIVDARETRQLVEAAHAQQGVPQTTQTTGLTNWEQDD